MAVDISEGARELVDISAESCGALGEHLRQIGDIISQSTQPPKLGTTRSTATKVKEKLVGYQAYCDDVRRRKAEIEKKTREDFERITAWRKDCGTEGSDLVGEIEQLYHKVRSQKKAIEEEQQKVAEEKEKVAELTRIGLRKDRKIGDLGEAVVEKKALLRFEKYQRGAHSSWIQCVFDEVRFKAKADQENEKLKIAHHQRLRKAAAQSRVNVIQREGSRRLLQTCLLAMQEEAVENRAARHLDELRRRFADRLLIVEAQLAQALGDEDAAREMVAEQVRRMEEEKKKAKEAEKAMKEAQKETRQMKKERDEALEERDEALRCQRAAEEARRLAEEEAERRRLEAEEATAKAEKYLAAMRASEKTQRGLEDLLRKKNKKIAALQRMLVELGAESDSDAPPDERPPAFFVNEDGKKVPRPRTRKERMNMAYREAETARWEMRLGMAAMLDKEVANQAALTRVVTSLDTSQREVQHVRQSNVILTRDLEAALARATEGQACPACAGASGGGSPTRATAWAKDDMDLVAQALRGPTPIPLAPSLAAAPPWSPARPAFAPADSGGRLLTRVASQPSTVPGLVLSPTAGAPTEKLAPLRKLKRLPADWRVGWK